MSKLALARWLNFAATFVLTILCLFWLVVMYRVLLGASNHVGFELAGMRYVALMGMVLFASAWALARARWSLIGGALCALSLAGSYALDHYNILLPYEVWLKRGMPERMSTIPTR